MVTASQGGAATGPAVKGSSRKAVSRRIRRDAQTKQREEERKKTRESASEK